MSAYWVYGFKALLDCLGGDSLPEHAPHRSLAQQTLLALDAERFYQFISGTSTRVSAAA